jgi:hypothetical protein
MILSSCDMKVRAGGEYQEKALSGYSSYSTNTWCFSLVLEEDCWLGGQILGGLSS